MEKRVVGRKGVWFGMWLGGSPDKGLPAKLGTRGSRRGDWKKKAPRWLRGFGLEQPDGAGAGGGEGAGV